LLQGFAGGIESHARDRRGNSPERRAGATRHHCAALNCAGNPAFGASGRREIMRDLGVFGFARCTAVERRHDRIPARQRRKARPEHDNAPQPEKPE